MTVYYIIVYWVFRWYYIEQEPEVFYRCFPEDFIPMFAKATMFKAFKQEMAVAEVNCLSTLVNYIFTMSWM